MVTISYAITVCNELEEVKQLVSFVEKRKRSVDEIVIQYDILNGSEEVKKYLTTLSHKIVEYPMDGNFSSFKNNLNLACKNEYIFQIDADEIPSEFLIENLPTILEENTNTDIFLVPRINTVEGITQEHIKKWGWTLNEKGWINFPDFQWRLYKNKEDIKWINKVHERLDGFKTFATLPPEEPFTLNHPKTIKRQEQQNSYYNTL